jgi:hypothetical protein
VRRGASWTAAHHLQLTVMAVARPVRSSVVPLVVRATAWSWIAARPAGVCPAGPPASIQRSGGVAVVDPARTRPWRRSPASGMRWPPSPFIVRDPALQPSGVQPVRCPGRPAPSLSGVRSPGFVVRGPAIRPAAVHPCGVHPVCCPSVRCPASGVQPAAVHPSSVQPSAVCLSVRSRPSPPTSGGGVGTRFRRPGNRHHSNRSRSRWVAAPSGGWSTAEQP